jgi:hypothetical protein
MRGPFSPNSAFQSYDSPRFANDQAQLKPSKSRDPYEKFQLAMIFFALGNF